MTNQKDRVFFNFNDKQKDLFSPVHNWLPQYVEDDDFLSGKISNALPESIEEE